MTTAKEQIRRRGWRIRYVPHETIADYNACYRVEYDGEIIHPPAADDLGIPVNEVWISEKWRPFERFVLFHELREIEYRADGHGKEEAHERAERDELERWRDDPEWRRMNEVWDEGRAHLPFPD